MHTDILFLTLRVFSATGGIEKVGRVVCKALTDLTAGNQLSRVAVYSMYDEIGEVNEKYIAPDKFKGFGQRKFQFVQAAVKKGCTSKVVILSHINLLMIGYLIKSISRQGAQAAVRADSQQRWLCRDRADQPEEL